MKLLPTALLFLVMFFSPSSSSPARADEPRDPEKYKAELLEIERRLDRKLGLLDEKLRRLEQLEAGSASAPAASSSAPVASSSAPAASSSAPATSPSVEAGPASAPSGARENVVTAPAPAAQVEAPTGLLAKVKAGVPASVSYGKNGFEFRTDDDRFSLAIQNRLQIRFAAPFDSDPRSEADLERDQVSFMIRRARTKFRGHAYWPWLKYYLQYDWSQPVLRDANLTLEKFRWAKVQVGRGKVFYNDERLTSSGNQQFVNRSIANDIFTVDRQQGVQLFGNISPGTWHDFSYYAGMFTGMGVGERSNDDDRLMYTGRLQWNALGGEMPFSQSDIEHHKEPALNLAFAGATNRSRCTSFETDSRSCRQLRGYADGVDGQYRVDQWMQELRFKWLGYSVSQELHWKEITDTLADDSDPMREVDLFGGLVQAGFFPHYLVTFLPEHLELAGRYAFVDPNTDAGGDKQQEGSFVTNYFFNGHNNKISFQVSQLTIAGASEQRYWAQWDFSF
ncbi:MAG: porin [Candidatus Binatia bacterium]